MEPWAEEKKSLKQVWRCHQLLSASLANVHLPRVSYQSRLSSDDKGNNEIIPEAVRGSSDIYLTAE